MANTTTPLGQQAGSHAPLSAEFKDKAQDVKEKTQEAGAAAIDTAKEMAGNVVDKTKHLAGAAADKAKEVASTVGHKAEDAKSAVGSGMQSLAHSIESGGRYLQQEDFRSIAADFTDLIRRNPVPAMILGIGLGFLLSRAVRS